MQEMSFAVSYSMLYIISSHSIFIHRLVSFNIMSKGPSHDGELDRVSL